jgi:hypothetical protein
MKILMVTPEYPPSNIGRGGIVYENLSKQLKKNSHCIKAIAGNFSNKKLFRSVERFPANDVNVNFLPLLSFPKSNKFDLATFIFSTIIGIFYIVKELFRSKNAVIYLHEFIDPIIDRAAFLYIVLRKKYILTNYESSKSPEIFRFPLNNLLKLYLSTIEKTQVNKASALAIVSYFLVTESKNENLVNKHIRVISTVPNNSIDKVNPYNIKEIERKYSLKNKKLTFAIDRINLNKGFLFLIEPMQTIAAKVLNARGFNSRPNEQASRNRYKNKEFLA